MNGDRGAFCDVNGARLHYQTAGTGHPVVLIHAGIASLEMWDDQFSELSRHYRVVRYDMRGFGKTDMVAGEFSHLDDLIGLLDHLQIRSAHLIGASKGAGVGFDCAITHPHRVSALVSVAGDPAGLDIGVEPPAPPLWPELMAAFKAGDLERCADLDVRIWVDGGQRTPPQVDPRIRDKVRAMDLIALRNEKTALGQEIPLEPPAGKRLAEIKAPLLLITGELDDPFMDMAATETAAQMEGATRVTIPGTAHLPNMEKPDEFNRLVLEFLSSMPGENCTVEKPAASLLREETRQNGTHANRNPHRRR